MLTRREIFKGVTVVGVYSSLGTLALLQEGCASEDQIVDGLKIAQQVSDAAQPIINPVNPEVGKLLSTVSQDIAVILKAYSDYEAKVGDSQSKLVLIQAIAATISTNLQAILDAVHVKNPELITYISIAVAVVNSAIVVLVNSLPAQQVMSARSAVIGGEKLPLLRNARKASDLKNAWNNVVKMEHPEAVVK